MAPVAVDSPRDSATNPAVVHSGKIAGIVIGIVVVLSILSFFVARWYRRKVEKRNNYNSDTNMAGISSPYSQLHEHIPPSDDSKQSRFSLKNVIPFQTPKRTSLKHHASVKTIATFIQTCPRSAFVNDNAMDFHTFLETIANNEENINSRKGQSVSPERQEDQSLALMPNQSPKRYPAALPDLIIPEPRIHRKFKSRRQLRAQARSNTESTVDESPSEYSQSSASQHFPDSATLTTPENPEQTPEETVDTNATNAEQDQPDDLAHSEEFTTSTTTTVAKPAVVARSDTKVIAGLLKARAKQVQPIARQKSSVSHIERVGSIRDVSAEEERNGLTRLRGRPVKRPKLPRDMRVPMETLTEGPNSGKSIADKFSPRSAHSLGSSSHEIPRPLPAPYRPDDSTLRTTTRISTAPHNDLSPPVNTDLPLPISPTKYTPQTPAQTIQYTIVM